MKKLIISGLLSCSLLLSGLMGGTKTEASTVGETVSDIGVKYIGVPYRWGGTTPSGFDCSGYLGYVYKQVGITLPRTAADIYNVGQPVSKSNLIEGDVVFFTTYKAGASHAGIYIGDNKFVHSASNGVKVDSLSNSYWTSTYYGAKRIAAANTGWVQTSGTWYYYNQGVKKTGWLYNGGVWYYLAANGAMKTGWVYVDGSWYYLAGSGAMKTGWVYLNSEWYYLASNGSMKTGWVWSNGKCYYLKSDGSMAKSTTIDGYEVGSDGAWIY